MELAGPGPTSPSNGTTPPEHATSATARPQAAPVHRQAWAIAMAAGLAAGLIAWLAAEFAHDAIKPRLVEVDVMYRGKVLQPTYETRKAAGVGNATLVFAILGGATGLAMGLAGGLAAGSLQRGALVGLAGLVAGSAVAALSSALLAPYFYRQLVPDMNDIWTPMLLLGGIWAAIGAVVGAAFAMGSTGPRGLAGAVVCSCVGGLLASALYSLIVVGLFPGPGLAEPVAPTALPRLVAMALVPVLTAIGAVVGAGAQFHPLGTPAPPAP